jgi:hypothetical protein
VAWAETVVDVTELGPDGLFALRFKLTTTEAGVVFDDVDPHVTVFPPFSFLPASVQHTLVAVDDYQCQVTMEYEWEMFYDRRYSIQISWTEPIVGSTSGQVTTGTVTAIVKYDRDPTVDAWTADTGDVLFPAEIRAINNPKIINVRITRGATVPTGFTFVDVDPIVKVEQLMA